MTTSLPNLTEIRAALAGHRPQLLRSSKRGHASVAMLLKEAENGPEVLFIIRAQHDADPWSGNIAFPGGRLNSAEETPRQAAVRETTEELSLDLGNAEYLGRLDDLHGATMPVLVSSFVYHLPQVVAFQPNHEVAEVFWCPLARLLEPQRHRTESFSFRDEDRSHPVVDLLGPGQPMLWGITYRLIRSFFLLCGHPFGAEESVPPTRF